NYPDTPALACFRAERAMSEEEIEGNTEGNTVKLPQSEAIMEAIIRQGIDWKRLDRILLQLSDPLVPWQRSRWLLLVALELIFAWRIFSLERHYFAAYMLAIYILNQVLLFLSPSTDDDEFSRHTSSEYRPFVRALSEFRLWCRGTVATLAASLVTFVDDLDMDVDGGALLVYFVLLFIYTMKQQIMHMIQYGYVPWNKPKKRELATTPSLQLKLMGLSLGAQRLRSSAVSVE
ncbi:Protein RER1, partial [Durusdinium trenchii]